MQLPFDGVLGMSEFPIIPNAQNGTTPWNWPV
jgi:hypothetical protein